MHTKLLLPLILALTVIACAPGDASLRQSQPETAKDLTIKRGGILKFANPSPTKNLNPFLHSGSARTGAFDPVYETLLAPKYLPNDNYASDDMIRWDYRGDDETVPWLAERWANPNPTTYTFHIRKGVRWSDGQELTAADVGFTWDYLKANKFPVDSARAALIDSYEIADRYTIHAKLGKPDPLFLANWREEAYILPKHVADRGDPFEKVAIGTGAFLMKEPPDTAGVAHVRNDKYWDQPRPHPDGQRIFYGLDRSAMIAAFVTSKIDLVKPDDEGSQLMLAQSGSNGVSDNYLANHNRGFTLNLNRAPFSDIRVRRALNLAIDRQDLVQRVNQGKLGMPNPPGTGGWATRWALPQEELLKLPGFNPATRQKDLADAKRLMAEAGYPNGFKSTLMWDNSASSGNQLTQVAANQLRDIGVELELQTPERGVHAKRDVDGDYDIQQATLRDGTENPYRTYHERFHTKGTFSSKIGVGDPQLDALIDRLAFFRTDDERQEVQRAVQRRILEQAYAIPLIDVFVQSWWQPWVHGYINQRGNQVKPKLMPATIWLDVDALPADRRSDKP